MSPALPPVIAGSFTPRGDVMPFVEIRKLARLRDAAQLLRVSILDVKCFKDDIGKYGGSA